VFSDFKSPKSSQPTAKHVFVGINFAEFRGEFIFGSKIVDSITRKSFISAKSLNFLHFPSLADHQSIEMLIGDDFSLNSRFLSLLILEIAELIRGEKVFTSNVEHKLRKSFATAEVKFEWKVTGKLLVSFESSARGWHLVAFG
jgi:hypothetical protein